MRNANQIVCVLTFLLACAGLTTTAVATIGACCKNVRYFAHPPGSECQGTSTTICDDYSTDDANGRQSVGTRIAVCTAYTTTSFVRGACLGSPGPGYEKLPAQGPDGYCCWAFSPQEQASDLTFSVDKCIGTPCSNGQPMNPIEP